MGCWLVNYRWMMGEYVDGVLMQGENSGADAGRSSYIEEVDGALFRKVFMGGVRWVAFHRDLLNELNVYPVPDGDTGTNLYLTLRGAVSSCRLAENSSLGSLLKAISRGALFGARGSCFSWRECFGLHATSSSGGR